MTTPDPRGFPRQSAMARLDLAVQGPRQHWTFDESKQTHKSLSTKSKRDQFIREHAIALGMTYTVQCLANPLRGNLKQDTLRARRCAILDSL